jgi:hypothetical protein
MHDTPLSNTAPPGPAGATTAMIPRGLTETVGQGDEQEAYPAEVRSTSRTSSMRMWTLAPALPLKPSQRADLEAFRDASR